jgi:hypothetical protein
MRLSGRCCARLCAGGTSCGRITWPGPLQVDAAGGAGNGGGGGAARLAGSSRRSCTAAFVVSGPARPDDSLSFVRPDHQRREAGGKGGDATSIGRDFDQLKLGTHVGFRHTSRLVIIAVGQPPSVSKSLRPPVTSPPSPLRVRRRSSAGPRCRHLLRSGLPRSPGLSETWCSPSGPGHTPCHKCS